MHRNKILSLLQGGDRRTIGRADEVATMVSEAPELFSELIAGLRSSDPLVRMRAADAAEKVSRTNPDLLRPHRQELLGLMAEAPQQELRWHPAAMVPRLQLSHRQRHVAIASLESYWADKSSIVRTFALQGLAELAEDDTAIRSRVIDILRQAARNGTPAMKARSRRLLLRWIIEHSRCRLQVDIDIRHTFAYAASHGDHSASTRVV
jgi:hypothetical protein